MELFVCFDKDFLSLIFHALYCDAAIGRFLVQRSAVYIVNGFLFDGKGKQRYNCTPSVDKSALTILCKQRWINRYYLAN